ncbi:bacteriohemerythrin [Sideroxydans lithotrophicus]|uniref:Hemerythrin-like metal-binding protein n=1 Tax=Sideroxydans lithotrophicus (strain ES-1) TaxID=580332 RepID=D5CU08_SIDLE|nr:bacteriohemerythrin [Sideroxydans lithotrophicus]ADE12320.1 hemerythrin-like metal-binding protein [Sideroxydans lithotrophicus ES-1]
MSLVWREQLSVGNDVIDSDHRYLIDIINRVGQSLSTRNRRELVAGLDSLSHYSQEHFAREEKIAHAAGYEQVPHLGETHQALLNQLDQVRQEVGEMVQVWSSETAERLTRLLRNWLIDHVIKEDLLMKPVLQKLSPLFDPR